MNETEPKYFANFKKELFEKLGGHEDQIARVSEQVTMLSKDVKTLQSDMTTMKGHMVIVVNELRWKKDKSERPSSELSLA
jgi:hypothetical protein